MARDLEWPTEGILNRFHYGFNRIRFVQQVPTGSRIRGMFTVTDATPKGDDGLDTLICMSATIEAELPDGSIRTAVVAEMLAYFVARR
jgi:acyl dehydratase